MPLPRLFFAFLGARFLGLIRHLPRFQHIVILSNAFQRHKGFVLPGWKKVKETVGMLWCAETTKKRVCILWYEYY